MIKDLEMMYDIAPLFEKELVIWGGGYDGCAIIKELREMGAGKQGITVCDYDSVKWGDEIDGIEIISPYTLKEYLWNINCRNVIVCVMIKNLNAQDEVMHTIEEMGYGELDLYTSFGVWCGIHYGLNSPYIDAEYRKKKISHNMIQSRLEKKGIYKDFFEYLAFVPVYNDEIIMVYQPGGEEFCDVYASIKQYGKNVMDISSLQNVRYIDVGIQKILNLKSGKIICLVREPISGVIANIWDNIDSYVVHGKAPSMAEEVDFYIDYGGKSRQEEWYANQMKQLSGIDVMEHPFDRKKGYQIIKSGNIELLVLKTENLDQLAPVIGEFLEIQDFHVYQTEYKMNKPWRFAYKEYKEKLTIPSDFLNVLFKENEFVKHFYSQEECEKFRKQYL